MCGGALAWIAPLACGCPPGLAHVGERRPMLLSSASVLGSFFSPKAIVMAPSAEALGLDRQRAAVMSQSPGAPLMGGVSGKVTVLWVPLPDCGPLKVFAGR